MIKEDLKLFFSEFGLSVFQAQKLEYDLASLLLLLDRVINIQISREKLLSADAKYSKQTLGQLLTELRSRITIENKIDNQLASALDKRNYLAHRFFNEDSDKLRNPGDLPNLTEKIRAIGEEIKNATSIINALMSKYFTAAGITDRQIATELQKVLGTSGSAN